LSAHSSPHRKKIMKGPIRRHPWLTVVLLLVALLSGADRLGLFGPNRFPSTTEPADDVAKYHKQVFVVAHVVDGDTVDLDVADKASGRTRVRLRGVDTPEVAGSPRGEMYFGPEASAFTKRMALGKRVRVGLVPEDELRDRYDRLLAYLVVEETGQMLNEALLRTGHAYADPRFTHPLKEHFLQAEAEARRSALGLWKNVTPKQYPHWKQKRQGR